MADFVTVYSDASYDSERRLGTWAFRARSDKGRWSGSGVCPRPMTGAAEAEAYAIAMGIWTSFKRCPALVGFFVNTDALSVAAVFWRLVGIESRRGPGTGEPEVLEIVRRVTAAVRPRWIRVKHVKGHSGTGNVRSYLNDAVDRVALAALRKARSDFDRIKDELLGPEIVKAARDGHYKEPWRHLIPVVIERMVGLQGKRGGEAHGDREGGEHRQGEGGGPETGRVPAAPQQ